MHAYIHKLHLCVSESESDNGLASPSSTRVSMYVLSNPLAIFSKPSAGVMTSRKPSPIAESSVHRTKQSEKEMPSNATPGLRVHVHDVCAQFVARECVRVVLAHLRFKYRLHSRAISGMGRQASLSVGLFAHPFL